MKEIQRNLSSASISERFWQPSLSLASCVRGALSRSTLGATLSDAQRYNYFPAAPTCSLSWFFSGHSELLAPGHLPAQSRPRQPLPDRLIFGGPFNRPVITWNSGPVHGMMLLFLPDAFHALTGIDPSAHLNQLVAAHEVLDAEWLVFCESLFTAADDVQRVVQIKEFLEPRWRRARPDGIPGSHLFADWSNTLAMRAAMSGPGRSLRQIDRRIKRWSGQPYRELRGIGRSELAFFEAMDAVARDELNWSDIADRAGYSDQSHLCRQTRRVTGFSPEELRQGIADDECFWVYRLWSMGDRKVD